MLFAIGGVVLNALQDGVGTLTFSGVLYSQGSAFSSAVFTVGCFILFCWFLFLYIFSYFFLFYFYLFSFLFCVIYYLIFLIFLIPFLFYISVDYFFVFVYAFILQFVLQEMFPDRIVVGEICRFTLDTSYIGAITLRINSKSTPTVLSSSLWSRLGSSYVCIGYRWTGKGTVSCLKIFLSYMSKQANIISYFFPTNISGHIQTSIRRQHVGSGLYDLYSFWCSQSGLVWMAHHTAQLARMGDLCRRAMGSHYGIWCNWNVLVETFLKVLMFYFSLIIQFLLVIFVKFFFGFDFCNQTNRIFWLEKYAAVAWGLITASGVIGMYWLNESKIVFPKFLNFY